MSWVHPHQETGAAAFPTCFPSAMRKDTEDAVRRRNKSCLRKKSCESIREHGYIVLSDGARKVGALLAIE